MRMRSTGMARTELVGNFEGIARSGSYLILSVRTTKPVKWHVSTALSRDGAIEMLKLVLKPRILLYFLSCLFRHEQGEAPGDY